MPKVWRVWLLARSACIVRLVGVKRDARLIDSQDVIEARDVGGNLREVAHTRLDNERWLKIDDHLTARSRQRLQTSQNRLPPFLTALILERDGLRHIFIGHVQDHCGRSDKAAERVLLGNKIHGEKGEAAQEAGMNDQVAERTSYNAVSLARPRFGTKIDDCDR